MPNPAEVATLIVGGRRFEDWTTVWVQQRMGEDTALFRFTAVERDPLPANWGTLQFKPGDECAIYLGGQLAVTGIITTRQVAYDANNHAVMLMGKGKSWWAARGAIIDKTSNYDNMTYEQIARKVIKPFGVRVDVVGKLDATPFKKVQLQPGDTVWTFLERLARPIGIILSSNKHGAIELVGDHKKPIVQNLVEGQNILRAQILIDNQQVYSDVHVRNSSGATNDHHGKTANEQEARAKGSAPRYSPNLVLHEHPSWDLAQLPKRAKNEIKWSEGTTVTANIVVQGWHRQGGKCWEAGDHVHVKTPMGLLDQEMKIKTATFTQDNQSGTLTTLELVMPWAYNAGSDVNADNPATPDPTQNTTGPETPPATPTDPPAASIPPSTSTGRAAGPV